MPTCFVIGPIGDKFSPAGSPSRLAYEEALEVFERVIVEACQQLDIDPVRADQISVAGEIPDQVFRHLRDDDVVIADVSGGNPNVMYELGMRHTTKKLTIQIGEYGQLPFDINAIRTIQFSRSARGLIDARNALVKALEAGILDGPDPLTASRLWAESRESEIIAVSAADSIEGGEDDSPGTLDQMATLEEEMIAMVEDLNNIGGAIEQIGVLTDAAGANINKANQAEATAQARMAIVGRYSMSIKGPSEELAECTGSFRRRMDTLSSPMAALLREVAAMPIEDRSEDVYEFLDVLIGMAESSREGMESLSSFGSAAEGLGSISRTLRGPGKKIGDSVRAMTEAVAQIIEWERIAKDIRQKSVLKSDQ
jgi:hypothetical protein